MVVVALNPKELEVGEVFSPQDAGEEGQGVEPELPLITIVVHHRRRLYMIEVPEILKYALNTRTSHLDVIFSSHFWSLFLFYITVKQL